MNKMLSDIATVILIIVFAVSATAGQEEDGLAVARVGDKVVTAAQLSRFPGGVDEALDQMVEFEVLCAAAKAAGYDSDPEVLEGARRIMVGRFIEDRLDPAIDALTVTEEEARDYYDEHAKEFTTPAMFRASVIRISVPGHASAEKRAELMARAEEARARALDLPAETATFGSVAVAFSDDQATRYKGGDTGWMSEQDASVAWERPVVDAALKLETPGEVSPVVNADSGCYIVKLTELRAGTQRPFEEVSGGIAYKLISGKKKAERRAFIDQFRKGLPVEVDTEALEKVRAMRSGSAGERIQAPPPMPAR